MTKACTRTGLRTTGHSRAVVLATRGGAALAAPVPTPREAPGGLAHRTRGVVARRRRADAGDPPPARLARQARRVERARGPDRRAIARRARGPHGGRCARSLLARRRGGERRGC